MTQLKNGKTYDLEERTALFAERIIEFLRNVKNDDINRNIIIQLSKSAHLLGQITTKRMHRARRKISEIRFLYLRKRPMKQNIG